MVKRLTVSRLLVVYHDHVRPKIPSVSLPCPRGHPVDRIQAHGHNLDATVLK